MAAPYGVKPDEKTLFTSEKMEDNNLFTYNPTPLYSYQLDAMDWMLKRFSETKPCLLGDEMGLGKTLTTIHFMEASTAPLMLLVVPKSIIPQWIKVLTTNLRDKLYYTTTDGGARPIIVDGSSYNLGERIPLMKLRSPGRHLLITNYDRVAPFPSIGKRITSLRNCYTKSTHPVQNPSLRLLK